MAGKRLIDTGLCCVAQNKGCAHKGSYPWHIAVSPSLRLSVVLWPFWEVGRSAGGWPWNEVNTVFLYHWDETLVRGSNTVSSGAEQKVGVLAECSGQKSEELFLLPAPLLLLFKQNIHRAYMQPGVTFVPWPPNAEGLQSYQLVPLSCRANILPSAKHTSPSLQAALCFVLHKAICYTERAPTQVDFVCHLQPSTCSSKEHPQHGQLEKKVQWAPCGLPTKDLAGLLQAWGPG